MRQIVTHFTDNDLYTFTCMYYIMQNYPRAEVRYQFFDRNNTVYPSCFAKLLREQINGLAGVTMTQQECDFLRSKCYFLPDWFFTFLMGYRFNPNEVSISQDDSGHLSVTIRGKWWSTIMWEMPILSTISELMHEINGDLAKVDISREWEKAYQKAEKMLKNGVKWADMGTRRRFSFQVQEKVIDAFMSAVNTVGEYTGRFNGTSNVYFGMKYNIPVIGTMSHQICSAEECVSGIHECNYQLMEKWRKTYGGSLGIYLPDCFTSNMCLNNLSLDMAKLYDGPRIDSGDNKEEMIKFMNKYIELGVNPATKSIVFSNALTVNDAIELHKWVDGRMNDSYGIGTHLMADVTNTESGENFPYSNIVIKPTGFRITEKRSWLEAVKISNDTGKMLGDKTKCEYLKQVIESSTKKS